MKKIVVSLATGLIIAGTAATSASAEDYQVESGDTLWGIANNYETSVETLQDLNQLDTDIIYPGQNLEIDKAETYTVKKGDTLFSIAAEYGVSVSEIKEWNKLSSNIILPAQELYVEETQQIDIIPDQVENKPVETDTVEEAEPTATAQPENTTEPTVSESTPSSKDEANGQVVTVESTAYTADCTGCSGITSTGIDLNANPNAKVIAVDPKVIPLGSRVYVEGYGEAIAGDIGGAIKGNRIDLHVPTKSEAYDWGRRTVDVTILD
ncbi:3D domain-containing protein [Sediminibacillus albus]|uniref:3D (Asp-Asp-Asp) domain-containing protein n=1 Tax=Sediminibacillus albus TaxID=407036 RepID=A0A1G8ZTL5_9BACI|nr:3D domain-containing protein [Sediminibacillus albus]SDK18472.1 3D (Asp-Asp-Asp) domain-containing protein [Sediminibacillus albus]